MLLVVVVLLLLLIAVGVGGFLFYMRTGNPSPTPVASSTSPSASVAVVASGAPSTVTNPTTTTNTPGVLPNGKPAPGRPDAGAIAVIDAGAPPSPGGATPGQKQYASSTAHIGGGRFEDYYDDRDKIFGPSAAGINACYAKTEFTPPDHQFEVFNLNISPAGTVTSVTPGGTGHPVLFPCVAAVLRSLHFPARPTGKSVQVQYTSRTKDNP